MSIKIMSMVWQSGPQKQSDRFVLLAIADYANDDGECWPSIAGICRKTCMTPRGIQTVIRRLESDGWLEVSIGGGRRNCNLYTIKTPHDMHPAGNASPHMKAETPHINAETPHIEALNPAPYAPEPSYNHHITINEPSEIKAAAPPINQTSEISDCLTQWASPGAVASFIAYRGRTKARALTLTGAKRLAQTLKEIFNAGGDTDDALGLAEERGWTTVKADWYFREQRGGESGRGQDKPGTGMAAAFAELAADIAAGRGRRRADPADPDGAMLGGVDIS